MLVAGKAPDEDEVVNGAAACPIVPPGKEDGEERDEGRNWSKKWRWGTGLSDFAKTQLRLFKSHCDFMFGSTVQRESKYCDQLKAKSNPSISFHQAGREQATGGCLAPHSHASSSVIGGGRRAQGEMDGTLVDVTN